MANITLRNTKGSPLTSTELDNNFANLNTDIASRITATGLLDAIKAVDGTGSGIDADTVRGLVSSAILPVATDKSSIITRDSVGGFSAGTATLAGTIIGPLSIELNSGGTGNRYAYIDFHGDDTYTDYSLRMIRENTGENASSVIYHRGTGPFTLWTQEVAPIVLRTSNTERMRITPGGNVGIGTNAPNGRLDVMGVAGSLTNATVQSPDGNMSRLTLGNTNRNWTISNYGTQFSPNGSFVIADETAPAVRLVIDTSGNVGINTTNVNPVASGKNLAINSTSGSSSWSLSSAGTLGMYGYTDGTSGAISVYPSGPLSFLTNNEEKMRINANGNVGIGTSTPFAKLTISGSALGTNAGDQIAYQTLQSSTVGNFDNLEITNTRQLAGSTWESAGTRLQQKVDFTWMGYIQFNGGSGSINPGGISFGTGQTNTGPTSIPESMRIDSAGNVGIGQPPTGARLVINKTNDPVTASSYTTGNLELVSDNTPPILGFHYLGVVARTIHLDSNGYLQTIANSGVSQRVFHGDASGNAPLFAARVWCEYDPTTAANKTGTVSRTATQNVATITITNHGLLAGHVIYAATGVAASIYSVDAIINANSFTITTAATTVLNAVAIQLNFATITAGGNINSIAIVAAGQFWFNFSTPMASTNYAIFGSGVANAHLSFNPTANAAGKRLLTVHAGTATSAAYVNGKGSSFVALC